MFKFVFQNMKATLKDPQYGFSSNLSLLIWLPLMMDKSDWLANGYLSIWPPIMYLLGLLFFTFLPNRVSKGMYLCPCTHKDRMRFLILSMRVKLGIVTLINLCGLLIGYLIRPYDLTLIPFELIYLTCSFMILNMTGIGFRMQNKADYKLVSSRIHDTLRKSQEYILCYVILLYNVLTVFILIHTTPDSYGDYVLHSILSGIDLILTGIYMIRYRRSMLQLSSSYEAVYVTKIYRPRKELL